MASQSDQRPRHHVTSTHMAAFNDMFDLRLADHEIRGLEAPVRDLMEDVEALWETDLTGIEMSLVLPASKR